MPTAERIMSDYSAYGEKGRVWTEVTPDQFSLELDSVTDKSKVVRQLVNEGPIRFFLDWESLKADFCKGWGEWLALKRDPIYRGEEYPHGGGKKVIGMGGMGSVNALHYYDMTKSLRALNYDASLYPWGVNMEPPRRMGKRLLAHLRQEVRGTGRRTAVFGHSLGSFQWMGAFAENPEEFASYVDEVYIDESPIPGELNGVLKAGTLFISFDREDVETGASLSILRQMEDAGMIKVVAVESSNDPMIRGRTIAGRESDHYIMRGRSHIGAGASDFVKIMSYKLVGEEVDFDRVPSVSHAPVQPLAA